METNDVKRLALVLAVQAKIDGMKAENNVMELNGMQLAYNDDSFNIKAEELRDLAQKGNVAIVAVGNAGCLGHAICEVLAQEHVCKVHVAVVSEIDFLDLKEHKSDIEALVLMQNDLTIQRLSVDDLIPKKIQYERNDIKQKEKQLSQQGWKRNSRKFRRI